MMATQTLKELSAAKSFPMICMWPTVERDSACGWAIRIYKKLKTNLEAKKLYTHGIIVTLLCHVYTHSTCATYNMSIYNELIILDVYAMYLK